MYLGNNVVAPNTIFIMKTPVQIARNDLIPYVRSSLSSYDVSGETFCRFIAGIKHLVSFMEKQSIDSYDEDVGKYFQVVMNAEKGIADRCYQRNMRALSLLDSIIKDEMDQFFRKMPVHKKRPFRGDIGKIAEYFLEYPLKEKRLSPATINEYNLYLSRFCEVMYLRDVSLSTLSRLDIIQFIASVRFSRRSTFLLVKTFLKYLFENGYIHEDLSLAIGAVKSERIVPLVSYFEEDEIKRIETSIDRSGALGKRNYAMLLLASRLGLRNSDVIRLQFDNIDWERNEIHLIQCKTRKTIFLPLLKEVGEALVDYILYGRPKSPSKNIFLSDDQKRIPVSAQTFTRVVSDSMRMANIDCRGRHHGPHSLRHSLATTLMKNGESLPVISEILGHKSVETTLCYLDVNNEALMECSLDVPLVEKEFYEQEGGVLYV